MERKSVKRKKTKKLNGCFYENRKEERRKQDCRVLVIRISSIFGWKRILNGIFCVNESIFCGLPIVISRQK